MAIKYYDEVYFLNYDSYDDLNLYEIGYQKCPSGYSFGPIIRNNYVMHYIKTGKGKLILENQEFSVGPNQAFFTPPNIVAFYQADEDDPWDYIWIHFNGQKAMEILHAAGITTQYPLYVPNVYNDDVKNCLFDILHNRDYEYKCIGYLYHLFQLMINNSSSKPQVAELNSELRYIRDVISYISRKFFEPIKVQEIADYCGLDRSYLCKIFKKATNYSLQEYLIFYRMNKAKHLLKTPDISIQNVAYSVGYPDPYAFSKIFKKEVGVPPRSYRKTHTNSNI